MHVSSSSYGMHVSSSSHGMHVSSSSYGMHVSSSSHGMHVSSSSYGMHVSSSSYGCFHQDISLLWTVVPNKALSLSLSLWFGHKYIMEYASVSLVTHRPLNHVYSKEYSLCTYFTYFTSFAEQTASTLPHSLSEFHGLVCWERKRKGEEKKRKKEEKKKKKG